MYMSKKARAQMRTRKRKAETKALEAKKDETIESENDMQSPNKKRKVEELRGVRVVKLPEGMSTKDAKKFRKDERRKAKKSDPNVELKFIAHDENEEDVIIDITTKQEEETKKEEQKIVKPRRKNQNQQSYPSINDLVREARNEEIKKKETAKNLKSLSTEEISKYVAMDCEMVGVGTSTTKSALARVSLVDYHGATVLDSFVQVLEKVTDYRTKISGVRRKDVQNKKALDFFECRKQVGEILKDKVLIGHALDNDLKALMWDHPKGDIRDTARYLPYMKMSIRGKKMRPRKLRDLAKEFVGMEIQIEGKPHDSVEDATAAMELYKLERRRWEKEIASKIDDKNKKDAK